VLGQTIQFGTSPTFPAKAFQQNYSYDGLNRLSGVTETGPGASWSQSFGYDMVGNRWLSGGMQIDPFTPLANGYDGNNHMSGAAYADGRGNQTQIGGYTYQYDAENRLTASTLASNGMVIASATYAYDADGQRVTKQAGSGLTVYVYDAQGQLAAEYTPGGPATAPACTTCSLMADHLGSTRMLADGLTGQQAVLYDYAPFGEALTNGLNGRDARWGSAGPGLHFTGKEQEGAEGDYQHFFGARYYAGGQGRFTSPDEPFNDQDRANPQSWNLYGYVRNNPLRFTDPTGRECVTLDNGGVGDNGVGNACTNVSLLTTHGVTVNGSTGETTSWVFGNAEIMRDIDPTERKDRINGQTTDIALNVLPFAKSGVGFAVVLGRAGSQSLLERIAIALGGRVLAGGEEVVVELANGTLVTFGAKVVGGNLTVNVSGLAAFGTTGNLFALRQGLMAAARAEGAETITVVAEKVGSPGLAGSLVKQGFREVGSATTFKGQTVQSFVKTYSVR
jgi:RHS repeat-associated protein